MKKWQKHLTALNVTKSTECDNILAKFIKDASEVISLPLTFLINLSLRTSSVAADFKRAQVVPLFKKGDHNYEDNYRPFEILLVIYKITERIILTSSINISLKMTYSANFCLGFMHLFQLTHHY